jgi:heat shock protein 4
VRVGQALEKIKAELDEKKIVLHGIEMVGGGTRIPAFQKVIEKVFKVEPVRTLNSSESIAKGCALMAAMKSPLFKVAEYGLEELNCYPVKLHWNFLGAGAHSLGNNEKAYIEKQTNMVFPAGCLLPVTKTVKFSKK